MNHQARTSQARMTRMMYWHASRHPWSRWCMQRRRPWMPGPCSCQDRTKRKVWLRWNPNPLCQQGRRRQRTNRRSLQVCTVRRCTARTLLLHCHHHQWYRECTQHKDPRSELRCSCQGHTSHMPSWDQSPHPSCQQRNRRTHPHCRRSLLACPVGRPRMLWSRCHPSQ